MRHSTRLALAGAVLAASAAHANVITAYWTNFNTYGYEIIQMPDLDQRRATMPGQEGLPGGGAMYCVPASTMNMLCYAANHGFPGIGPGPGNYQSQSKYGTATANMKLMGVLMQTDANNGTGGGGWDNGLNFWFNYLSNDDQNKLTFTHQYCDGHYCPKLPDMVKVAKNGSIVSFAYGRYSVLGTYNESPLVVRTGGHVVTLAKALATGGFEHEVWVRDPADDAMNLFTQSPFGLNYRTVAQRIIYTDTEPDAWRFVSQLTNISSDETLRIIDEYVAIKPKAGYAFKPGFTFLDLYEPYAGFVIGGGGGGKKTIQLGQPLIELVLTPDPGIVAGVVYNPASNIGALVEINTDTGALTTIEPDFTYGVLTFGRKHELYASDGEKLYCFDYDNEMELTAATSAFPKPAALAYDDLNDTLVALSTDVDVIGLIPEGFSGPVLTFPLSDDFNAGAGSSIDVGPDGVIWVSSPNEGSVRGFRVKDGVLQEVEKLDFGFDDPESVAVDDGGHVFVCASGQLREFAKDGAGAWQEVASDFGGPANGCFLVARSRTNFDPALHTGPEWDNLDPEQLVVGPFIADCPGDVNADGVVNSTDLNLVLGAFGASLAGDINHDGGTDSSDLNLVLSHYGEACAG